jgi:Cu-Zn family superoxide dismutase
MFREHARTIRNALLGGILVTSFAIGGSAAYAQEASSPEASPVTGGNSVTIDLLSADGASVASATFTEDAAGVTIDVESTGDSGLAPGEHGIHIHETGSCTPTEGDMPFDDAGGHFNPTNAAHGGPDSPEHHAGDLGNLTVNDDGSIAFEFTSTDITLAPGSENSLNDADGSALVIHQDADDLTSQPSGESHARVACGVIYPDTAATPAASPVS